MKVSRVLLIAYFSRVKKPPIPSVEFRGVSKTFGSTRAVASLSLEVAPGEFFSLLGPSGCGKTTTLRLLAGLEEPDRDGGAILIDGAPVTDLRPYERDLSMVFQHYALFPHLSVARNVAFGLEQRSVAAAERTTRVRDALALVRLNPEQFGNRMPSELSGGQRQRVALARALVIEPSILLLDEPLGAIDLKLRKQMQLELKALNRTLGITFIYVTHDQEEALTLSDRIAVMDHGEVVQIGGPAEIYESPRSAFVAEFIGESNFLSGTALTEQNGLWTIGRDDLEFRIPAQPGIATGSSVTVAVRPEWLRVCPPGQAPSKANMIPATVREVVYLGETLQVVAEVTATGKAMRVTVPNEGQLKNPIAWKTGDEIVLTWLPGDSQVLEENSS